MMDTYYCKIIKFVNLVDSNGDDVCRASVCDKDQGYSAVSVKFVCSLQYREFRICSVCHLL